jgi:diacylglycerol kinase
MLNILRLFKSFQYAFRGLGKIFREEQNLQVELIIAIIAIAAGIYFKLSSIEWCVIIIAIFSVLLAETLNSAVERLADVLRPRIHQYVKEIKDIMAAAVMLSSLMAVVVGLIIFFPYLLFFIKGGEEKF